MFNLYRLRGVDCCSQSLFVMLKNYASTGKSRNHPKILVLTVVLTHKTKNLNGTNMISSLVI